MTTAEQIEIAVQIVRRTDHAVCVTDGIQEVWLPLSQITMTPAMATVVGFAVKRIASADVELK